MPTTELSVVDILKRARALIEKEEHWTQCTFARNKEDNPRFPDDPAAVKWSAMGAIRVTAGGDRSPLYAKSYYTLVDMMPDAFMWTSPMMDWEKRHSHAEVLAAFDKAIALASREGL